jgi:hypothetical protein
MYSGFGKTLFVPRLQEKTTLILEVIDIDDEKAFQWSSGHASFHCGA